MRSVEMERTRDSGNAMMETTMQGMDVLPVVLLRMALNAMMIHQMLSPSLQTLAQQYAETEESHQERLVMMVTSTTTMGAMKTVQLSWASNALSIMQQSPQSAQRSVEMEDRSELLSHS